MTFWERHDDDDETYHSLDDEPRSSCPLLIGEAFGRTPLPLPGLPHGIAAFTVPQQTEAGPRARRDPKGRPKTDQADLVAKSVDGSFDLPRELPTRQLVWVLSTKIRRQWRGVVSRFGDAAWDTAITLARAGIVVVECTVVDYLATPVGLRLTGAWQELASDVVADLTGWRPPADVRRELLVLMAPIRQLTGERILLARQEPDAPLRVPAGSRTRAKRWSVYEAAIRAACVWYPATTCGERFTEEDLAADASRNSHGWTEPRRFAFANLVRKSFALAVDEPYVAVLMRGPVEWRIDGRVADAHACEPFIGIPANSLRVIGVLDHTRVHGVLVVENRTTFQKVCMTKSIVDRWLCVWGRGYSPNAVVTIVKAMGLVPVAGWSDLDADGIGIIASLEKRLGRTVRPVGMDVDLWRSNKKRRQDDSKLLRGSRRGARLAKDGPEQLRELSSLVAGGGDGVEQELIRMYVLPELDRVLSELENGSQP